MRPAVRTGPEAPDHRWTVRAGRLRPARGADGSTRLHRVPAAGDCREGTGYGRSAVRSVQRLAFRELGAHRLWLDVKLHNARARHLYQTEGFVEEGVLRECLRRADGGYDSLVVMSRLAREFKAPDQRRPTRRRQAESGRTGGRGFPMIDLLRRLMSRLRPRAPALAVRVSDETVTLFEGTRQCVHFAWREVQEVVTFKRDCLTYDDIRLGFRIADGWIEISEDSEGWSDLNAALADRFPTVPTGWYEAVMLPPFETCYRVLYRATEGSYAIRCPHHMRSPCWASSSRWPS